jgi:hypothetical protein
MDKSINRPTYQALWYDIVWYHKHVIRRLQSAKNDAQRWHIRRSFANHLLDPRNKLLWLSLWQFQCSKWERLVWQEKNINIINPY